LPAGTYYYTVSGVNALGEGPQSAAVSATLSMPQAPYKVAARVDSDTDVTLTWGYNSAAVSYTVYQASSSSGDYTPIKTGITVNTIAISGLTPNTACYFKISSVNILGEGPQSSFVEARTASSISSLTSGWTNDTLTDWEELKMYTFPVTSGTHYSILWRDSSTATGDTASIRISARYQTSGNSIYLDGTSGSSMFQAAETGVVLVTVTGQHTDSTGTYRIAEQD
jgi:hypothetical protein